MTNYPNNTARVEITNFRLDIKEKQDSDGFVEWKPTLTIKLTHPDFIKTEIKQKLDVSEESFVADVMQYANNIVGKNFYRAIQNAAKQQELDFTEATAATADKPAETEQEEENRILECIKNSKSPQTAGYINSKIKIDSKRLIEHLNNLADKGEILIIDGLYEMSRGEDNLASPDFNEGDQS